MSSLLGTNNYNNNTKNYNNNNNDNNTDLDNIIEYSHIISSRYSNLYNIPNSNNDIIIENNLVASEIGSFARGIDNDIRYCIFHNNNYIIYTVAQAQIRVISILTSRTQLLKGHTGKIVDLRLYNDLLLSCSNTGEIIIWKLLQNNNEFNSIILCKLRETVYYGVQWIISNNTNSNKFMLFGDRRLDYVDLNEINTKELSSPVHKYYIFPVEINDAHYSFNNNCIAVGLKNGQIQIFSLNEEKNKLVAKFVFLAHDGNPIDRVIWVNSEYQYKLLITASKSRSELKLWGVSTDFSQCFELSNITLSAGNSEQRMINIEIDSTGQFLFITYKSDDPLSRPDDNGFYVINIFQSNNNLISSRFAYLIPFNTNFPIVSLYLDNDLDSIQLFTAQTKPIVQYNLRYSELHKPKIKQTFINNETIIEIQHSKTPNQNTLNNDQFQHNNNNNTINQSLSIEEQQSQGVLLGPEAFLTLVNQDNAVINNDTNDNNDNNDNNHNNHNNHNNDNSPHSKQVTGPIINSSQAISTSSTTVKILQRPINNNNNNNTKHNINPTTTTNNNNNNHNSVNNLLTPVVLQKAGESIIEEYSFKTNKSFIKSPNISASSHATKVELTSNKSPAKLVKSSVVIKNNKSSVETTTTLSNNDLLYDSLTNSSLEDNLSNSSVITSNPANNNNNNNTNTNNNNNVDRKSQQESNLLHRLEKLFSKNFLKVQDLINKQMETEKNTRIKEEKQKIDFINKSLGDSINSQLTSIIDKSINQAVKQLTQNIETKQINEFKILTETVTEQNRLQGQQIQELKTLLTTVIKSNQELTKQIKQLEQLHSNNNQNSTISALSSSSTISNNSNNINNDIQSLDDIYTAIRSLLSRNLFEQAFSLALSQGKLDIVVWLCESIDYKIIFNSKPCKLSNPVLLSLMQQLGFSFKDNISLKLLWLNQCVLALNQRDSTIQTHIPVVFNEIIQHIQTQLHFVLENIQHPNYEQTKLLKHLLLIAQK